MELDDALPPFPPSPVCGEPPDKPVMPAPAEPPPPPAAQLCSEPALRPVPPAFPRPPPVVVDDPPEKLAVFDEPPPPPEPPLLPAPLVWLPPPPPPVTVVAPKTELVPEFPWAPDIVAPPAPIVIVMAAPPVTPTPLLLRYSPAPPPAPPPAVPPPPLPPPAISSRFTDWTPAGTRLPPCSQSAALLLFVALNVTTMANSYSSSPSRHTPGNRNGRSPRRSISRP